MPESAHALSGTLQRGCAELALTLSVQQQDVLLGYLNLLARWNRTYNLTAVRDPVQMVTRHLLDSLSIAPAVVGRRCLDVGTGAGLPGVPLAILLPETEFHLLDSNGKKTRFLFQVKTALALDNIVIHQARVESFSAPAPFDLVVSRAYASLADMVVSCRHLLRPGGSMLAMKGTYPDAELESLGDAVADVQVQKISVPGLAEERHLATIHL
ncbi:MAG: 16S rRNA (guanine(527)-N(7))-methyltransferase RsmG [Halioglobus sp.]